MIRQPITPSTIEKATFNIPVYQRLFVWEEDQINKLFEDLKDSFDTDRQKPYYIGIISLSKCNNEEETYEVVDGQQRLTFLMLLGAALQDVYSDWDKFLRCDENLRLHYVARDHDEKFLESMVKEFKNQMEFSNVGFKAFYECFEKFKSCGVDLPDFAKYVYEKCSFLTSVLPEEYSDEELNIFFEKLNATGKQLEAHEILKVKLISKYIGKLNYFETWNSIADFSKKFSGVKCSDTDASISIDEVLKNDDLGKNATEEETQSNTRGILKFPVFLLHVLAICTDKKADEAKLNSQKLLNLFADFLKDADNAAVNEKITKFIDTMKEYRIWLDNNIIHLNDNKVIFWNKSSDTEDEVDEENNSANRNNMRQLQSMLYVSSSDSQRWVLKTYLDTNVNKETGKMLQDIDTVTLTFELLQDIDNKMNPLNEQELNNINSGYPKINRYWFWKLDFILWLQRGDIFKKDDKIFARYKTVVDNFTFKSNRSIEHLYAQNREKESATNGFNNTNQDKFGNLAMISSSSNSKLSNKTVGVKFKTIEDDLGRDLESLKLLKMFGIADGQDANWTYEKAAETHEKEMISLLKKYYEAPYLKHGQ